MSSRSNRLRRKVKFTAHFDTSINSETLDSAARIPYRPEPWARKLGCWDNVAEMVRRCGGRAVSGFSGECKPGTYLYSHDVWESPTGELIDITPNDGGEPVLFFRHPKAGRGPGSAVAAFIPIPGYTVGQTARMMKLTRQRTTETET